MDVDGVVVICFQFLIFDLLTTTDMYTFYNAFPL